MTYKIISGFTRQGLHHWPEAPERRAYLRCLHRHLFRVKITSNLDHPGREVEFHDLADRAQMIMETLGEPYHPDTLLINFGKRSCEMLAHEIALSLRAEGYSVERVEVSEDEENSGEWSSAVGAQEHVPDSGDLAQVLAPVAECRNSSAIGHASSMADCATESKSATGGAG